MSDSPSLGTETVALARQIVCFAATGAPVIGKVDVQTLRLAQQVSSQYPIASLPPAPEDQATERRGRSAGLEDLYPPDWVIDSQKFKRAITIFEKATSSLRKDTPSGVIDLRNISTGLCHLMDGSFLP